MKTLPISPSHDPARGVHPSVVSWTGECGQQIELEMLAILESPFFRFSRRSCEFLRHVVERALQGRAHSLKERAIGIEVLGRDPSYDTGSDAGVRVRANDVRRRLGSFYQQQSKTGVRIELPPGSYVPQFVWTTAEQVADAGEPSHPAGTTLTLAAEAPAAIPRLTLRHLAAPTLLALFVCAISIRYQLLETTPFQLFWSQLLKGRSQLAVVLERRENQANSADINEVQAILPLLNLAQAFHVPFAIETSDEIENAERDALVVRITNAPTEPDSRLRLAIRSGQNGLQVVDRLTPEHRRWSHAVLITVLPGSEPPLIWIGATDGAALRHGLEALTNRSSFPRALSNAVRKRTVTQILLNEWGEPIS